MRDGEDGKQEIGGLWEDVVARDRQQRGDVAPALKRRLSQRRQQRQKLRFSLPSFSLRSVGQGTLALLFLVGLTLAVNNETVGTYLGVCVLLALAGGFIRAWLRWRQLERAEEPKAAVERTWLASVFRAFGYGLFLTAILGSLWLAMNGAVAPLALLGLAALAYGVSRLKRARRTQKREEVAEKEGQGGEDEGPEKPEEEGPEEEEEQSLPARDLKPFAKVRVHHFLLLLGSWVTWVFILLPVAFFFLGSGVTAFALAVVFYVVYFVISRTGWIVGSWCAAREYWKYTKTQVTTDGVTVAKVVPWFWPDQPDEEGVEFDQMGEIEVKIPGFWCKLFRYGYLKIRGTGTSYVETPMIINPWLARKVLRRYKKAKPRSKE